MKGFAPSLLDKLTNSTGAATVNGVVSRLSIEELKDSVARDLEAMLNTRVALHQEGFPGFPECSNSVLAYGLRDFAGMSLSSVNDRLAICTSLGNAILGHEPRLRDVQVSLRVKEGAVNRLNFAISAVLHVSDASEPVNFDAILQPSTLRYAISKTRLKGTSKNLHREG